MTLLLPAANGMMSIIPIAYGGPGDSHDPCSYLRTWGISRSILMPHVKLRQVIGAATGDQIYSLKSDLSPKAMLLSGMHAHPAITRVVYKILTAMRKGFDFNDPSR